MSNSESEPSAWRVFALRVGELSVPAHTLTAGADNHPITAPVIMWALHRAGETVLFDTGTPSPATVARHRPGLRYRRRRGEWPRQLLRSVGIDPEDVTLIINSHLHWDHSSNNHRFPRARIIVQDSEWLAANDPPAGHEAAYSVGLHAVAPWRRAKARTELVDGDVDLLPGLRLISLPGHTPGSQGVRISTTSGDLCLAGDLVPLASHLQAVPPALPGVVSSRAQAFASLEVVAGLDARVLGSHDDIVFDGSGSAVRVDDVATAGTGW